MQADRCIIDAVRSGTRTEKKGSGEFTETSEPCTRINMDPFLPPLGQVDMCHRIRQCGAMRALVRGKIFGTVAVAILIMSGATADDIHETERTLTVGSVYSYSYSDDTTAQPSPRPTARPTTSHPTSMPTMTSTPTFLPTTPLPTPMPTMTLVPTPVPTLTTYTVATASSSVATATL